MVEKNTILVGMVVLAAISRLFPHMPNFTAVGAMALFAGTYFSSRILAFFVPMMALFVTDLALGFHDTMWAVYISFAMIVLIGEFLIKNKPSVAKVVLGSLLASGTFFIISNFGVWVSSAMYSKDFSGLVQCYVMALPFLDNQILGDFTFSGSLFAAYYFVENRFLSARSL